jgi:hypothetical protein
VVPDKPKDIQPDATQIAAQQSRYAVSHGFSLSHSRQHLLNVAGFPQMRTAHSKP